MDFKVIFLVIPTVESVLFLSTAILSLISLTPVVLIFFFFLNGQPKVNSSFLYVDASHVYINSQVFLPLYLC